MKKKIRLNTKKIHKKIKKEFEHLLKEFGGLIKLIYLYGSATKKIKKGHDIDILIVIDDTTNVKEGDIEKIKKEINKISKKLKKEELLLHIQPLKPLSLWLKLIIKGEPWLITSLRNNIIIYDKDKLIPEIKNFANKKVIYNKTEIAERLLERAEEFISENRKLLLETASNLSNAATEAAQILLLFDNKVVFNKDKILKLLKKKYSNKINIGIYQEIIDIEKKINKGTLTEFTEENLNYYTNKIRNFNSQIENMIMDLSYKNVNKK